MHLKHMRISDIRLSSEKHGLSSVMRLPLLWAPRPPAKLWAADLSREIFFASSRLLPFPSAGRQKHSEVAHVFAYHTIDCVCLAP